MTRRVVHYLDGGEMGGAERSLLHLLGNLDRNRWDPLLLYPARSVLRPVIDAAREMGVESFSIPDVPARFLPAALPRETRWFRWIRPVLFHAHLNWPLACKAGLLSARLAGVPATIATVQLFGSLPRTLGIRIATRLHRALVDRHLAVSADIRRLLLEWMGIPAERVRVVPNGVDPRPFTGTPDRGTGMRLQLGIPRSVPLILTVARLEAQKGHVDLIRAATEVPDAVFVLAGDGPDRAALEDLSRNLDVASRIRFLGIRSDVPDLLAAADLFVLPSLYEGLPLAILEAMAAEKPIVATRIGGVTELLEDGHHARLVEPRDPAALAGAIRELLLYPALGANLAASARGRVADFTARAMADRVMENYDELAAAPAGGGDREGRT